MHTQKLWNALSVQRFEHRKRATSQKESTKDGVDQVPDVCRSDLLTKCNYNIRGILDYLFMIINTGKLCACRGTYNTMLSFAVTALCTYTGFCRTTPRLYSFSTIDKNDLLRVLYQYKLTSYPVVRQTLIIHYCPTNYIFSGALETIWTIRLGFL